MTKRVNFNGLGPAKIPRQSMFRCELFRPTLPKRKGTLLVCGIGCMGQLGLGMNAIVRKKPTVVPSMKNIVDIKAGGMHSICLNSAGEVYSFGCNDEGALGRDTSKVGSEYIPMKIAVPGKAVRISAGDSHSACLLENGRVFAWGSFRNSYTNMGLTMEGNQRSPVEVLPGIACCDIASGTDHLVILTCKGMVYTVGYAQQGQLGRVSLRTSSGESRRGLKELLTPGLTTINGIKNVDRIWTTNCCTFVKQYRKQSIYGFGLNNFKQLGITNSGEYVLLPKRNRFRNVRAIAGGLHHTVILTEDNICYSVGRRDYGRLGLGTLTTDIDELTPIEGLYGIRLADVACGEAQSFAITYDGKLYAWGMGSNLQLGTGDDKDALEPVLVVSRETKDKKVFKVASGGQHTLILVANEEEEERSFFSTY